MVHFADGDTDFVARAFCCLGVTQGTEAELPWVGGSSSWCVFVQYAFLDVSIQPSASVSREIRVSYRLRILNVVPLSLYMIVISYTLHWVRIHPVQQVFWHGQMFGEKLGEFSSERNSDAWSERNCRMLLSVATNRLCGVHRHRSQSLTLDIQFLKTLFVPFLVPFTCSLLVISTKLCINGFSLEERYLLFLTFGLDVVCFRLHFIVPLS